MRRPGNRPSTSSSTTRPREQTERSRRSTRWLITGATSMVKPRADGVRNFLAARAIELPEGLDGDRPDARTVTGLGNRKNELVLEVLRVSGVQVYAGAVALVQALRALGSPVAVVSASENTDAALEAAGIADPVSYTHLRA